MFITVCPVHGSDQNVIYVGPSEDTRDANAAYVVEFDEEHNLFRMITPSRYSPLNDYRAREMFRGSMLRFANLTGLSLFSDGFFISDKDAMLFKLKYSGLQYSQIVEAPLI